MFQCYSEEISIKDQQIKAFNKAQFKLLNKLASIEMLINDCRCSAEQKKELRRLSKT